MLAEIHGRIDDEKFSALIEACQNDCLQAVIRPFGLARVLFVDKEGGPVDTIHNVMTQSKDLNGRLRFLAEEKKTTETGQVITRREYTVDQTGRATYLDDGSAVPEKVVKSYSRPILVFSTDDERSKHDQAIDNAGKVAEKVRHEKDYNAKVEETKGQQASGKLVDPLSREGRTFDADESVHIDHTVPCIEIARDARVSLADIPVHKLANMSINLMPMREYANTSKNGYPIKIVVERWEKNIQAISKLEAIESRTAKQDAALKKLKQLQAMDLAKLMEADETVRSEISRIVYREYYFGEKFRERVINTSVSSGLRMGLQQAIGVLMEEFVRAVFAEVKDAWKNGFKGSVNDAYLDALKGRLMRVAQRVQSKWKDAASAALNGAISGFLSNLVTVIINTFATTEARVVRMLREGSMSLYRAFKVLAFPPEGMSLAQAADAASKLFAAGLITGAGIELEMVLQGSLTAFVPLVPFAPYISAVGAGLVTGLSTAFVTYMLDYLDFFGVNAQSRHEYVVAKLNDMISISHERAEKAASMFGGPSLLHLT